MSLITFTILENMQLTQYILFFKMLNNVIEISINLVNFHNRSRITRHKKETNE